MLGYAIEVQCEISNSQLSRNGFYVQKWIRNILVEYKNETKWKIERQWMQAMIWCIYSAGLLKMIELKPWRIRTVYVGHDGIDQDIYCEMEISFNKRNRRHFKDPSLTEDPLQLECYLSRLKWNRLKLHNNNDGWVEGIKRHTPFYCAFEETNEDLRWDSEKHFKREKAAEAPFLNCVHDESDLVREIMII